MKYLLLKIKSKLHVWFYKVWYEKPYVTSSLLQGLSHLYYLSMWVQLSLRRRYCLSLVRPQTVIWSVTNLTIGGNAKTPMVILLATEAHKKNIRVAVLTRGYKRIRTARRDSPENAWVRVEHSAHEVGDEARMMATQLTVPVYCVDDPVLFLSKHGAMFDLWIVDDAWSRLQVWSEAWWMMDGAARLGNGRLLPAGPLRFPAAWMKDPIVANSQDDNQACLYPIIKSFRSLDRKIHYSVDNWPYLKVLIVTAIARPGNVEKLLHETLAIQTTLIAYPDHESWPEAATAGHDCVLITEKDAARLNYQADNIYVIELEYSANNILQKRIALALSDRFNLGDGKVNL